MHSIHAFALSHIHTYLALDLSSLPTIVPYTFLLAFNKKLLLLFTQIGLTVDAGQTVA